MIQKLLLLNGAILTGCAFFIPNYYQWIIPALLFFLPALDKAWFLKSHANSDHVFKVSSITWVVISFVFLLLLSLNENYELITLGIILFTALPEEWFFRAYFLQQLNRVIKREWLANGVVSILFVVLHIPTQGLMGLCVFFPSLLFGYIYLKSGNFLLVVILHALSNLVYLLYLQKLL